MAKIAVIFMMRRYVPQSIAPDFFSMSTTADFTTRYPAKKHTIDYRSPLTKVAVPSMHRSQDNKPQDGQDLE